MGGAASCLPSLSGAVRHTLREPPLREPPVTRYDRPGVNRLTCDDRAIRIESSLRTLVAACVLSLPRRVRLPLIVSAVLWLSGTAAAQWALSVEVPFRSSIPGSVDELVRRHLGLDEAQLATARGLIEEHERRFADFVAEEKPVWEDLRRRRDALEGGTAEDYALRRELDRRCRSSADRQAQIDRWLMDEIRRSLSEDQSDRWYDFVMAVHGRRWGSRAPFFSEEAVDVDSIMRTIVGREGTTGEIEAALRRHRGEVARLMETIDEWLVEFARGSFRRQDRRVEIVDGRVHVRFDPEVDREERRLSERRVRLHARLRDERRRARAELESMLGPAERREFDRRYWVAAAHAVARWEDGEHVPALPFAKAEEIAASAAERARDEDERAFVALHLAEWELEATHAVKEFVARADDHSIAARSGLAAPDDRTQTRDRLDHARERLDRLLDTLIARLPAHLIIIDTEGGPLE